MARVIINSDDFGYSVAVNKATKAALNNGLISSTTMLTNFDEGFTHAATLLEQKEVSPNAVGIHINLTEGTPLSNAIKDCNRFCSNGQFHGNARKQNLFKLSAEEKSAVRSEIDAQLSKFTTLGFTPSHIDSHHHVHTEWAILNIVMGVAKKYNVNKIRLTRNVGSGIGSVKKIYKTLVNAYIKLRGFRTAQTMGDLNDYLNHNINTDAEIMVHALLNNDLITDIDGISLQNKINRVNISSHSIINYTEL